MPFGFSEADAANDGSAYDTPTISRAETPTLSRATSKDLLRAATSSPDLRKSDVDFSESVERLKANLFDEKKDMDELTRILKYNLASMDALSSCFLADAVTKSDAPEVPLFGLNVTELRTFYRSLAEQSRDKRVEDAVVAGCELLLARLVAQASQWRIGRLVDSEFIPLQLDTFLERKLRILVILLENPLVYRHDVLTKRLFISLASMNRSVKTYFGRHFAFRFAHDETNFTALVQRIKHYIIDRYSSGVKQDEGVIAAVRALGVLYNANEFTARFRKLSASSKTCISFTAFYCTAAEDGQSSETIAQHLNFKEEVPRWQKMHSERHSSKTEFCILNYPFVLDPIAKTRIFRIESMMNMSGGFEQAFVHHAFVVQAQKLVNGLQQVSDANSDSDRLSRSGSRLRLDEPSETGRQVAEPVRRAAAAERSLSRSTSRLNINDLESSFQPYTNPYLVLEVRRDRLVEDSLDQVIPRFYPWLIYFRRYI